ncbi:CHASE domain-containing protein [Roseateles paludis]|uniref:histidine kinase n=1 Tax=Roseateles paludis TaxID=3145238 RepID=A0ABV0G6B2_9BURK
MRKDALALSRRAAVLTLGYALLGWLGTRVTLPGEAASPLFPAAGFALAALAVYGLRWAPCIWLGAMVINYAAQWQLSGTAPVLNAALVSLGAMAQAALGAWLIRRRDTQLTLTDRGAILRFYGLGVGVGGLVSPSVAALVLGGAALGQNSAELWLTWWMGDALGAMIAAPITLTLLATPPEAWRSRRYTVALPLLALTTAVVLGMAEVSRWDLERRQSDFDRDATHATLDLERLLREPFLTLAGVQGIAELPGRLPSQADFARATAPLVHADGALRALGWARRVARADVAAFEAAARADGLDDFHAHDRSRTDDAAPPEGEDLLAIRLIEPLARNRGALGVNIRSIPHARAAAERAIATGVAAATAGFQLTQDAETATGVVIYQPLFDGPHATPADRRISLSGLAFVTLRPDLLLRRVVATWPERLDICLTDITDSALPQRLAGPTDCERAQPRGFASTRVLDIGQRQWAIHVSDTSGASQAARLTERHTWPFALMGLGSSALIGMLLLALSGRTEKVESLVRLRTAALEHEMAERRESERALRDTMQRFRSIFEQAPIGIAFCDVRGRFQEVNPAYCRLVGYSAEALMGMSISQITLPEDQAEDRRLAAQLLRREITSYSRQKRYRTGDGREIQVRARVSLLPDAQGQPQSLLGVVEDLSDEQRALAAEAANRAKSEFLSRMSHELRTPLNAILGFTQLMEMDTESPLPRAHAERAEQIAQAGWHLLAMIDDTLDLSRIEAGSMRAELSQLALAPLVASAQAMVRGMAQERQVELRVTLAPSAAHVYADPTRLVQILTNLLSNAIKYNRDGGLVFLEAEGREPGWVEIRVRDTGPGLSAEQRLRLFQPFERLGQERSSVPGTGIGLVLSRHLAEMLGGSLDALDVTDSGACFVLRLRAAAPPGLDGAESSASALQLPSTR